MARLPKGLFFTGFLVLSLSPLGCDSGAPATAPLPPVLSSDPRVADAQNRILADRILEDVLILSADSMEGRAPGTPGEARAVTHIARRMAEAGLELLNGDGFLPVELVGMTKRGEASSLVIEGPDGALDLTVGTHVTFWSTSERPLVELQNLPLVFVGHGVEAPEVGWDDFKGADLRGKVLLFLNDDPSVVENGEPLFGGDIRTYYGRWTYKFEQAQRQGAAGAIVVHTDASAAYGWSVIGTSGERLIWQRDYRLDLLAWMDSTRTAVVAESMGTTVPGLFEMASNRDFRPVDTGYRVSARIETAFERVVAPNVAGMIRGSDPDKADEFIVFTAHHDHLGVDPTLEGDQIFNGALDNALGVASILALADAMVEARPARSVLFLSVTAEEGGLLGSGAFVQNPPIPLRQIVANINVDSPQPYGITRDFAAIGIEMNTMGDVFREVAAQYGLRAEGDPNPAAGSFYRSDQVNFAKAGIPALYLQAGRDYAEPLAFDPVAHRLQHYHQVSDQVSPEWDLRGVERDLRALFEVSLRIAEASEPPRWFPGNEFESAWRALYGREP
jgi:Zn-dependent M28 family amino/carboxypeptidase